MAELSKNIKLIIKYVLGPAVFCILAVSIYHQVQRQPNWKDSFTQIFETLKGDGLNKVLLVMILMLMNWGLEVCEYSPKKVKQSITGNGNADKEQVWQMLQHIMQIPQADLRYLDSSDALAVAVCHHFQDNPILKQGAGRAKNWADFAAKNPGRIR